MWLRTASLMTVLFGGGGSQYRVNITKSKDFSGPSTFFSYSSNPGLYTSEVGFVLAKEIIWFHFSHIPNLLSEIIFLCAQILLPATERLHKRKMF